MAAAAEDGVMDFEELGIGEELASACRRLGWLSPTKVQAEAIPHALQGRDLIGLRLNDSGKFGAFALPILQALMEFPEPQPFFACVISPTRDLAILTAQSFRLFGADRCALLLDGQSYAVEAHRLRERPPCIVIGTPGRLARHLSSRTTAFSLRTTQYLVLDEADMLVDEDCEESIDQILSAIPRERRTYLFSDTVTKKVKKLHQRACLRNPVKIEAAAEYNIDSLKQHYLFVPAKYKEFYLVYVLNEKSGYPIVFTSTCEATRLLASLLRNLGLRAIPVSRQMSESERLGAVEKFETRKCNILICSDAASRGLDIPRVHTDTVINYDIPSNPEDYIHRVGRFACDQGSDSDEESDSGVAISLICLRSILLHRRNYCYRRRAPCCCGSASLRRKEYQRWRWKIPRAAGRRGAEETSRDIRKKLLAESSDYPNTRLYLVRVT